MTQFLELASWQEADALRAVPEAAGVFRIEFAAGLPYIGKTANLRRRLRRLLLPRDGQSARLSLREIARRVQFGLTGSPFESDWLLYRTVKADRPAEVRQYLKLRSATFVKVLLGNRFPRACLTQRITRSRALFYGPFPNRLAAERFQDAFLDLFGVRRCSENLQPSPDHPGCIWGELQLCLRPCQAACDDSEYGAEVLRMKRFLATDGASLLVETKAARESASAAMEFESAGRHHRFLAKIEDTLRLRGDLSRELDALCGAILQRSADEACVDLTPLYKGSLQATVQLACSDGELSAGGFAASFRDAFPSQDWLEGPPAEKEEHLALLQRWHRSSFRQGEFVPFADMAEPPVRKLSNAALRIASGRARSPAGIGAKG